MHVHAYLRASTDDQNAERAKGELKAFAQEHGQRVAGYFVENVSGATLDRPELQRLLNDAEDGDVLLLEGVDRLTRLKDSDWQRLKRQIEDKGLSVVAMDLPTSYQAFQAHDQQDFMRSMLRAINTMMLDMLAAIAHKDYVDRRKRQSQGIAQAMQEGKYRGRKADSKRHEKVRELRDAGHSLNDVAKLAGYSKATVCRVLAQESASQ